MKPKPQRLTPEPTEPEIQHAAFLLWEEQGRPAGRDLEIWLAAKERLKHTVPNRGGSHRPAGDSVRRTIDARTTAAVVR